MAAKLIESTLGMGAPWPVNSIEFDEAAETLTLLLDFMPGTRFAVPGTTAHGSLQSLCIPDRRES